jgi:hypothetical protein
MSLAPMSTEATPLLPTNAAQDQASTVCYVAKEILEETKVSECLVHFMSH